MVVLATAQHLALNSVHIMDAPISGLTNRNRAHKQQQTRRRLSNLQRTQLFWGPQNVSIEHRIRTRLGPWMI